jgi:phytoene synthase
MSPDADPPAPLATRDDIEACRAAIRVGSRTFHAASHLLPVRVREPALALYAFCREADDAIDGSAEPRVALHALEERLDRAYRRDPIDNAADRALADVVARFRIPRAVPAALLEGFAWDAEGRVYPDLSSLRAYGMRVAGTVGVMMSLLMGVRSAGALARAADLGIGMQLSNIARDVGEDARLGRVYLPRDWLAEAGIDADEWLAEPQFEPDLGRVVARLVDEAQRLYDRAAVGVTELRSGVRAAQDVAAAAGDHGIGDHAARDGCRRRLAGGALPHRCGGRTRCAARRDGGCAGGREPAGARVRARARGLRASGARRGAGPGRVTAQRAIGRRGRRTGSSICTHGAAKRRSETLSWKPVASPPSRCDSMRERA